MTDCRVTHVIDYDSLDCELKQGHANSCGVCGLHAFDGHGYVSGEPEWHKEARRRR